MSDDKVISAYRATGRIVFERPLKQLISLNGGRFIPRKDAIERMRECLRCEGVTP